MSAEQPVPIGQVQPEELNNYSDFQPFLSPTAHYIDSRSFKPFLKIISPLTFFLSTTDSFIIIIIDFPTYKAHYFCSVLTNYLLKPQRRANFLHPKIRTKNSLIREKHIKMPARLFIASIGNPPPYHNTFHSAGHILLKSLCVALSLPPLARSPLYKQGLFTTNGTYTLFQSPSQMNISGTPVSKAWKAFLATVPQEERGDARLVVLHDELEADLGAVKVKPGSNSPRGHNGLKSIRSSLQGGGVRSNWVRIGVGIGRPQSRDSRDVANFVLQKMGRIEMEIVEGATGKVLEALETLGTET